MASRARFTPRPRLVVLATLVAVGAAAGCTLFGPTAPDVPSDSSSAWAHGDAQAEAQATNEPAPSPQATPAPPPSPSPPTPTIASLVPNAASAAGGQTITLLGAGFVAGATSVTIAGAPATNVTVLGPTQLTFVAPPFSSSAGTSTAQTVNVSVSGVGGTSATGFYYYPSVSPTLQAFMGDVGITMSGGGVSTWADQSGQGHDMTQPTASIRPTLISNYNSSGRPALEFTGTWSAAGDAGQSMQSVLGAAQAQPVTIYVAGDVIGASPMSAFAPTFYSASTPAGPGPSLYFKWGTTVAFAGLEAWPASAPTGTHALAVVFNGASSSYWVDGVQLGGAMNLGAGPLTSLQIGAYYLSAISRTINYLHGHVAELRVVSGADSAATIATTSAILDARWSPASPLNGAGQAGLLWSADFEQDAGVSPGNQHALSTLAPPLALARDSGATVQTSASTVDTTPGVDEARVGSNGVAQGLVIEEARRNIVLSSRNLSAAPWVGQSSAALTASQPSPDGTSNATRIQIANGGTLTVLQTSANNSSVSVDPTGAYADAGTVAVTGSLWVHPTADGGSVQWATGANWEKDDTTYSAASAWARSVLPPLTLVPKGPSGSGGLMASFAYAAAVNYSYFEGIGAGPGANEAIDQVVDLPQAEVGQFATEAILSGATGGVRAGDHLQIVSGATAVDRGRLSLYLKMYPKGGSLDYSGPVYLWYADANDYALLDPKTQSVTMAVGGSVISSPAQAPSADGGAPTPLFAAQHLVEWYLSAGAGAGLVQYRVDGASVVTLLDAQLAAPLAPAAGIDLLSAGTTGQFSSWLASVAVYRQGVGQIGPYCGDGIRNQPNEECDDGAANGGTASPCSAACVVQDFLAARVDAGAAPPGTGRSLGAGRHPVVGGTGGFAVAFVETGPTGSTLRAEAFDLGGLRVASFPSVGVPAQTSAASDPVVAALSATRYATVWTDFDSSSGDQGIAMAVLDTAAGAGPVTHASSTLGFSEEKPDALWLGETLVVAWTDWSNAATAPDLVFRTFDGSLAPTSGQTSLAASPAAESDVALGTFNATWAAAWRASSGGTDTIHVRSGSAEVVLGPIVGGPASERPTLAQVGPTSLFVAFSATVDDGAGGTTTMLEGAVVDLTQPTAPAPTPLTLDTLPDGGAGPLPQASPASLAVGSTLWLSAWTGAQPGDPLGDELWLSSAATSAPLALGAAAQPLPRAAAQRAGDQRNPSVATTALVPSGALVAAWDDYGGSLATGEGQPDVVVEVIPLPIVRAGP